METHRVEGPAIPGSSGSRMALHAANGLDRLITAVCRVLVLVTGVALTAILTGGVAARYVFASGGIDAAQELPERLFPWFIVGGAVLAAQAGGHMAVDWLLAQLDSPGRRRLLLFGNALVIASYLVLCQQALEVAEIAQLELSPVLGLPGSHGYWAVALGCLLIALATICSSIRIALIGPESQFSLEYKEL